MPRTRTLYVKVTTFTEIHNKWGGLSPHGGLLDAFYIQCTKQGAINWDKNTVYTDKELVPRNNVVIVP